MKLIFKKKTSDKQISRIKKKVRIRKKVSGSAERPRLCVYRSLSHIYANVIDDSTGKTLFSASSLTVEKKMSGKDLAKEVGSQIAKLAMAGNVKSVVFDRNGFIYHGRIKTLADAAREAGLLF